MTRESDLLRAIRARTGETQAELGLRLGVSQVTLNSWERGRSRPRVQRLAAIEDAAQQAGVRLGPDLRVIAIDDDPVALEIVAAHVAADPRDIELVTTTSAVEGLVRCGREVPDLLLLDLMMPGLDGIQVANRITATSGLEGLRIVFVTATSDLGLLRRAAATADATVLTKPLDPTALQRIFDEILAVRA